MKDLVEAGTGASAMPELLVGFVTALVSGYFALKYLIRLLKRGGIHYFAYYCWIVGVAGLIYFSL